MRFLIRLLLVLVLVAAAGTLWSGYWSSDRFGTSRPGADRDRPAGTSGTVDTSRARERGAEIGERAAVAAARARAELDEAAITARIKAKMALDEIVKARAIDVTTTGQTVTLNGTVESPIERERAERLARETEGVTTVDNRLAVRR
jgi:hypothetical protein